MVAHETVRVILCRGLTKSTVRCILVVSGWQDLYDLLPAHKHAYILRGPTLQPADKDEHLSFLLPDMFKQSLQTALDCTILIQSALCQIACITSLDALYCRGNGHQSCTFKAFGQMVTGTCLGRSTPSGVSLPITTIPTSRDGSNTRHLEE